MSDEDGIETGWNVLMMAKYLENDGITKSLYIVQPCYTARKSLQVNCTADVS